MVFTILVPLVVAVVVPRTIDSAHLQAGLWRAGWLLVIAGAAVYCICLLDFLAAGGTPAILCVCWNSLASASRSGPVGPHWT